MEKPNVSWLADLINRCAGVFGGFIAGVICTFAFVTVFGRVDLNNSGSHREKLRLPEDFAKYADSPSAINNPAVNHPTGLPEGDNANAVPQVVHFDDLDGKPSTGPKNAPVTIVEFSDFHCPFSKRVQPTIQKLIDSYPGKIRHVWRHFPLPMHQGADRTHAASQCAMDQGKFWEFHSAVFAAASPPTSDQALMDLAAQVGIEPKAFESCLSSNKYTSLVQQEVAAGQKTGTSGTPTFFINGKRFVGAQPYETFEKTVQQEIDGRK